MGKEIEVTFLIDETVISTKTFKVGADMHVPLPADALFTFKKSELRIKALWGETNNVQQDTTKKETH